VARRHWGNYRPNEAWTLRAGLAYDQTPTQDLYRTPRVPDSDRTWLSIGGQYKVSPQGRIDFAYAHIWMKDAAVNLSGPPAVTAAQAAGRGRLVGDSNNKIDILSVQYTHSF
jgi:long-chain fatty acid transport protein